MFSIRSFLYLPYSILLILLVWNLGAASSAGYARNGSASPTYSSVHIGVILDSNSSMGAMANSCISMAHSDFYAAHPDYQTRLVLHIKDAQDGFLDVASAAIELMKNEEVHSILSRQTLTEDKIMAELGGKVHVPVVSFTARSQSSSYTHSPYFVRTTPDDSNQAKALVSLCKGFEWHEAVILYEDTDYGSQFLSRLTNAFQEAQIRLAYMVSISTSAEDRHIKNELKRLKKMQTRVFLVHMNAGLGSRLFLLAKEEGMMSEGYAWLVTDSLGNFMNSIYDAAIDSMEGVIGLRPYIPKLEKLDDFRIRWKKDMLVTNPESKATELNVYGLWAYDTVWALAMAAEKVGPVNLDFLEANYSKNGSEISNLRISQFGPKLVSELQNITFEGLTGDFHLHDDQLINASSALEIFNVYGTSDRPIGYWTPHGGIVRKLALEGGPTTYSTSTKKLKRILWPGDSDKQPKGWSIPSTGKLRVGVPKKDGFKEFINVLTDPQTNKSKFTGFSIDVFLSALPQLPFQVDYEFILNNGSYNDVLHCIKNATYDMVVGDVTILADRSKYVDFTLPYSESGTVMVVKNKKENDMWIFIKPFRWDLWLLIFSTCIFIGIVLHILEHRANNNSDSIGPKKQQLGFLFWFPISALAMPERKRVENKWSTFVLVVWLSMAFILMQSYTANLSAMFTLDQFDYIFSNDDYIGCQKGAFVKEFLINHHLFNESRIKQYATVEEYHDAMTKGSKNGGIDAIFDEIPYMKLFLDRYKSEYKIVGHANKTIGLGFAFPLGSPLVIHFSRAILAVTESANMTAIQQKNFGPTYSSYNPIYPIVNQSRKLTAFNFGGLFIMLASALALALFFSETSIGRKLTDIVTYFGQKSSFFLSFTGNRSRVHHMVHPEHANGDSSSDENVQGPDHVNIDHSSRSGTANEDSSSDENVQGPDHVNIDHSYRSGTANEDSSSGENVQGPDHVTIDHSSRSGLANESRQGNLNISGRNGQVNKPRLSSPVKEIQLSELRNS